MFDIREKEGEFRAYMRGRASLSLRPPAQITAERWVEDFRVIEKGPIKGGFRIANFEIARGPIRSINESGVEQITILASAQIMKTTTIETALGYYMHMRPSDIGLFFPTVDGIAKFNREKLEPMIRSTPELADLWGGKEALDRKRDDYTDKVKIFPGGSLNLGSAENPRGLASSTLAMVALDEASKMKVTTGGDAVVLAKERLKNFTGRSLCIVVSTPEDEGCVTSREYLKSDRRLPFVQCPNCGEWHDFTWERFVYKDDEGRVRPQIAHHVCPHCQGAWTEGERVTAVTTEGAISWRQTRPFECCDERQDPLETRSWEIDGIFGYATCKHCGKRGVSNSHAGYWGWEGYHPRVSSERLARAWLDAQSSPGEIEAFLKSKLARTFKREADAKFQIEAETLQARMEPAWTWLPPGVLFVTAGADVQPDRIEVEFVGWGQGDESWSLDYLVLEGDTSQDAVWYALDEALKRRWQFEDGREMSVSAACVDAGDQIDTVLAFTHIRKNRRILAVKSVDGAAGQRKPIWPQGSKASVRQRGRMVGAVFYGIGSQSAKDRIGAQMQVASPGPGYMHIPQGRFGKWFDMMASEVKKQVSIGGRIAYYWTKKSAGGRNEAFDCRVYAIAALEYLRAIGLVSRAAAPGAAAAPRKVEEDGTITVLPPQKPTVKRPKFAIRRV